MFPRNPLGRGKLGISPLKVVNPTQPPSSPPPPPEDEESSHFLVPFDRDLGGKCVGTNESIFFPTSSNNAPTRLEETWIQTGVPEHDIQTWLRNSTLGFFMTCIKNPLACEPKSLIFWVGKDFKIGFDQRDGVNIFFLGWRHHLTIDLDNCVECCSTGTSQDLLRSRFKLLSDVAHKTNLAFGIFSTDRGYHAIELSRKSHPTDPECFELSRQVGGDTLYVAISALQGWRLRLSPKSRTPDDFVIKEFTETGFEEFGKIHPQLGTLIIGPETHIPETHIQMMECYLGLSKCITGFLRDRGIESVLSKIMSSSKMAQTISTLINSEIHKWPTMYEQKLFDQPFKSYNLTLDDL